MSRAWHYNVTVVLQFWLLSIQLQVLYLRGQRNRLGSLCFVRKSEGRTQTNRAESEPKKRGRRRRRPLHATRGKRMALPLASDRSSLRNSQIRYILKFSLKQ